MEKRNDHHLQQKAITSHEQVLSNKTLHSAARIYRCDIPATLDLLFNLDISSLKFYLRSWCDLESMLFPPTFFSICFNIHGRDIDWNADIVSLARTKLIEFVPAPP